MPITGDGYFCLVKPVIYVTKEGMKMKGHMDKVLAAAAAAAKAGEVPVAAAITDAKGDLIALAENRMVRDGNALHHAEILAIRGGHGRHWPVAP
jgi:tRNA(Arg) A34 adenosine deaminase TadA